MTLTTKETERYERQIMIDGIGPSGQEKLRNARVAVVGLGGLGSAIAYYLTAAGVGSLTLVDFDFVELSNLNRQILHGTGDIGSPKVESAYRKLKGFNPDVKIEFCDKKVTRGNAKKLLEGADCIVDALDNFEARYVLNRASLELGRPFIHGACCGFEGRVSTFIPGKTACFECLFPSPPQAGKVPVLGATPGFVGSLQAMEVVKYLTGVGDLLEGRLLIFDGKTWQVEVVRFKRDPNCKSCGGK